MTYVIQEYTSSIDGKVRFRILKRTEYEKVVAGTIFCHFYGGHQEWDYEQAQMEIDNLRLERRMDNELRG